MITEKTIDYCLSGNYKKLTTYQFSIGDVVSEPEKINIFLLKLFEKMPIKS